jgi:hypothetical protein
VDCQVLYGHLCAVVLKIVRFFWNLHCVPLSRRLFSIEVERVPLPSALRSLLLRSGGRYTVGLSGHTCGIDHALRGQPR